MLLQQLPSIVDCMAKLDTSRLSILCIQHSDITLDHLITFTNIDTLSGLILETPTIRSQNTGLVEATKILRNWARIVHEKRALRKLRLLVLHSFSVERDSTLDNVSIFPSLCLVGFFSPRVDKLGGLYKDWRCIFARG